MTSQSPSLPSVPRYEIRLQNGASYAIFLNGRVAVDSVEGLPLEGIKSKARAEAIVSRMRAF